MQTQKNIKEETKTFWGHNIQERPNLDLKTLAKAQFSQGFFFGEKDKKSISQGSTELLNSKQDDEFASIVLQEMNNDQQVKVNFNVKKSS